MNGRYAVALALVGWYLMLAPLRPDRPNVDRDAPLSTWKQSEAFGTGEDCEFHLRNMMKSLSRAKEELPSFDRTSFYRQLRDARCVAGDDPRLKVIEPRRERRIGRRSRRQLGRNEA
jgi:hypothetical protein